MNDVKMSMIPPPIVSNENHTQKLKRTMAIDIEGDGKTKITIFDDENNPIRYIPAVSLPEQLKLEFENIGKNINYYS